MTKPYSFFDTSSFSTAASCILHTSLGKPRQPSIRNNTSCGFRRGRVSFTGVSIGTVSFLKKFTVNKMPNKITKKEYRRYKKSIGRKRLLAFAFIVSFIYLIWLFIKGDTAGRSLAVFAVIIFLICVGIYESYRYIKKQIYLNSPIAKVDRMTGEQFEEFLKYSFERFGYKVSLTPKTGDFGADLVCKKDGEILIIQAKRYKGKVKNTAIQEIIAAKAYYGADKCMVATNSYFTDAAVELAKANNVELWDRKTLFKNDILHEPEG